MENLFEIGEKLKEFARYDWRNVRTKTKFKKILRFILLVSSCLKFASNKIGHPNQTYGQNICKIAQKKKVHEYNLTKDP